MEPTAEVGGHRLAACDREGALHRGSRGRVLLGVGAGAQPRPQRAPGERPRRTGHHPGIGGVGHALGGEGAQQVGLLGRQVGEPAQEGHDVALGDVVEQREDLVADAVASEPRVDVGGVDDRREAGGVAEGVRLVAAKADDRVGRPRAQRTEAVEAGAPQHGEQHGLGPVVRGVPGGVAGPEHPAPGGAGAGFEVGPVGHHDALGTERGAEGLGGGGHHVGLGRRTGPEAVVDVHRGDLAARRDREHQEGEGVGPAGHRADQRGASSRERAPGQQLGGAVTVRPPGCGPATGPGP